MPETSVPRRLTCPRCGETILSEDKFCFHCGRRLGEKPSGTTAEIHPNRFAQWTLVAIGVVALVLAGYEVHHQSRVIAALQSRPASRGRSGSAGKTGSLTLHPVVSTTTTYPTNLPSSAGWTSEVETYQRVQFGLRLPTGMNDVLSTSSTEWIWGKANTPYRVVLEVVANKPASASQTLGAQTYGTSIVKGSATASQALYINWASGKWVEVLMAVPVHHVNWLGSIAKSVQIS